MTDRAEGWMAEGFSGLGRVVAEVAASAGLLLSLMVYFGWVRTTVVYDIFGIGTGSLALTVQDYALRSVSSTVRPLAVVLLALLLARPLHRAVLAAVRSRRRAGRAVAPVFVAVGAAIAVLGLVGFSGLVVLSVAWPMVPICLGLGPLLIAYGVALRSPGGGRDASAFAVVQRVALAALVVLTLFWSAAVFARIEGVEEAERIASRPTALPGAVVFSPHRLHVNIRGITETALPAEAQPRYRYRYDGLRLLIRTDGRFFLIPTRWRPGAHAIILADDPSYRLEFFRGP